MPTIFEGTFSHKATQENIDFMVKLGAKKEEAKSLVGNTWRFRSEQTDSGFVVVTTCEENPSLNMIETYKFGVEQEIESPVFGGKCKMVVTQSGGNVLLVKMDSEQFGQVEMKETYSDDGVLVEYTKPFPYKQMWQKEKKELGWFRFTHADNLKEFMKGQGLPEDVWNSDSEAWINFENFGSRCVLTEVWENVTNVVRYKLDTEADYSWPGMPKMDRKFVTTKVGNGKYKTVMRGKNGEKEEWDLEFHDKGCTYTGLDHKSGQSCKIYYEPFVNIYGKFRLVSQSKAQEFNEALGMPADMVAKMIAEAPDTTLTITKKNGGYINVKFDSKIMPMDLTFKFNEEFEFSVPGMAEKIKSIETLHGDTILYVGKTSKYTMKNTTKFTGNFAIQTSEIVGTNITATEIMERI